MQDKDIKKVARFMIDKGATVRRTAMEFGVSKSTIHVNVTKRLKKIDPNLYKKVKKVLDKNKAERAIRGGMATRKKYLRIRKEN